MRGNQFLWVVITCVCCFQANTSATEEIVGPSTDDKTEIDPLPDYLSRSFPVDLALVSLANPWGERVERFEQFPDDFNQRVVAVATMYAAQAIRFDGYFGSDDDGSHYHAAADGKDGAFYGSAETRSYRVVRDKVADDLKERTWICLDLFMHTYAMAGFPIRDAMTDDYSRATEVYTRGGTFSENVPKTALFFRRVRNVQIYFQQNQLYSEQRITKEQCRDPSFRPIEPYQVGDLVFLGHYGDKDGEKGWWRAQHTGVVGSIDDRKMPMSIFNMRVSKGLVDDYDGEINQTRTVAGKNVFYKRFSDRYSLIGFGRVVNWLP